MLDPVGVCAGSSVADAGLSDVARFLAQRAPFDVLAPRELGEVVAHTQLEFYAAGEVILSEDGGPVTFLRIIHSGGVDITHDRQLLDLLGAGDTFGHAAMLSGLPPGFEARAAEDTLCYRIPVLAARPLLERAASREVKVGVHEPGHQPVAELIRTKTVGCTPDRSVASVACEMTEAGANAAIVMLSGGEIGIVTDRDLRTRVLAVGASADRPVRDIMTAPAYTVTPGRLGGEVLFEMLERGIRHAPVITEAGRLVGVVEDADLFAVQPRSWFGARRAIARAQDLDVLAELARGLPGKTVDLHAASIRAVEVARVLSALVDATAARALDLASDARRVPQDGLVWVALGSVARRELTPGSKPRGALLTSEHNDEESLRAARDALERCGFAATVLQMSDVDDDEPDLSARATIDLLVDRRAVWGTPREALPVPRMRARAELLCWLRARMSAWALPTGFEGNAVLTPGGKRVDRLGVRRAALSPIVDVARWAGFTAGSVEGSTPERLQLAATESIISKDEARTLSDAFELTFELHLRRHVEQIARGESPDDTLDPSSLSALTRSHLREVFRALSAIQRRYGG